MKKRHLTGILSCVLSAIMLATPILPVSGSLFSAQKSHEVKADTGTTRSEDWEYKINDTSENTISIVKYYGNETDLKVPDEIDGKTVTEIAQKAIDQTSLHTISLPKTLTYIGDSDFSHAKNLTSIEVRDSEYGKTRFWTDENGVLYGYVDHHTDVDQKTYNKYLELLCYPSAKIEKSYTVDPACKEIEGMAFDYAAGLKEIKLPDGLTTIGRYVFLGCEQLEKLQIPETVTTIKGALDHIKNLRYLYLCGDVPEDFVENERLKETGYSNGFEDQRTLTVMINEAYWDNYQAYRESFDKDDGITFEKWDGKTIKPIQNKEPENSNNSNKKPSDNNNSNTKPAASASVGSVIQISPTKITQPTTVKLLSVKNQKGKKAKVKWKKNTKVSGYQVQYSMKKNFKSGKKNITIKKNKITSTVLKKLKKKKTYYVRVRTYKKLGNKTYYSKWSNVKKVKIKK